MNTTLKVLKANSIFILLANIIMILSFASVSHSQVAEFNSATSKGKNEWITFSPLDKSFTVELPKSPKHEKKIAKVKRNKDTEIALRLFKCTKSLNSYFLPALSKPKYNRIVIWEIDVSNCERSKSDLDIDLFGFLIVVAGDHYIKLSDKTININGMSGREIIYKNGSEIYARTLALDADKRIFVVTYDRINGDLAEEERIFRTFKPKFIR